MVTVVRGNTAAVGGMIRGLTTEYCYDTAGCCTTGCRCLLRTTVWVYDTSSMLHRWSSKTYHTTKLRCLFTIWMRFSKQSALLTGEPETPHANQPQFTNPRAEISTLLKIVFAKNRDARNDKRFPFFFFADSCVIVASSTLAKKYVVAHNNETVESRERGKPFDCCCGFGTP